MPNISKTGIMDIDEPKKENNDPFGNFNFQKFNIFKEQKPENFKNYGQG